MVLLVVLVLVLLFLLLVVVVRWLSTDYAGASCEGKFRNLYFDQLVIGLPGATVPGLEAGKLLTERMVQPARAGSGGSGQSIHFESEKFWPPPLSHAAEGSR